MYTFLFGSDWSGVLVNHAGNVVYSHTDFQSRMHKYIHENAITVLIASSTSGGELCLHPSCGTDNIFGRNRSDLHYLPVSPQTAAWTQI